MNELMIFVFLILNFAIAWWNAWAVGSVWPELERAPMSYKLVGWSGAIMSAVGFTWCYMVLIGMGAVSMGKLDEYWLNVMFSLGYLTIIIPALLSGVVIWLHSLMVAYRERSFASVGVAGWNTFAQVYNTYNAVKAVPEALKVVGSALGGKRSSSNDKGGAAILVVLLVILAVAGGTLTTYAIMRKAMARTSRQVLRQGREIRYS